jgi:small nuclear ribonucleoprotein (snRNP)-like protein
MTRNEFERKYLNKMVEVILYDNDTFKGYLYSTNEYMNKTKLLDVKNYYFVGNDIRENGVRFRKSHIKKIKLLSCLSISKCYKLGDDK